MGVLIRLMFNQRQPILKGFNYLIVEHVFLEN